MRGMGYEWISVFDMLPAIDVEVIVLQNGYDMPQICFGHIVDEAKGIMSYDGWNIPDVTHWFPSPELPDG